MAYQARRHFKNLFGNDVEDLLYGRNLEFDIDKDHECIDKSKLHAAAQILTTNVDIKGWNGTVRSVFQLFFGTCGRFNFFVVMM